ncbi:NAD(P)-binding protein [Malaciobacter marinus]|uniref:NAD(P)-binding protein n=1 Tax=Malaciobacter marinus TaxID=505249 RepID=UPI003AFFA4CB
MNIAIIGAGFSGCLLYNKLIKENHKITIFEKSRGTGGRLSTKYINDKFCDHGTPYFEAKNQIFIDFCNKLVKQKILKKYKTVYIPTNGINKVCSSLIDKKDLKTKVKITTCKYENEKWTLIDNQNNVYKDFDILLITIPAVQILELNINLNEKIEQELSSIKYDSIFTLILHKQKNLPLHKGLKNINLFKKIIDNSKKYNYDNFSSFVLHTNEYFSTKHNEKTKEELEKKVIKKLKKLNIEIDKDFIILPHLWKYAFAKNHLKKDFIFDKKQFLGICGDYFYSKNIEASFLSSTKLAGNI